MVSPESSSPCSGGISRSSSVKAKEYDKNNRYRLMDMSARDCNRDGAALRFVAEKLSKQTSEVKILMIICDGQPNDDGYSGSAAEADLRGIKLEYARKGVKIYAAAIGEDRPRIERIYGDGYGLPKECRYLLSLRRSTLLE